MKLASKHIESKNYSVHLPANSFKYNLHLSKLIYF